MTTITSDRYTDLQSDLTAVLAHITAIDTALASSGGISSTKEYSFDSGTGRQTEKFNSPLELIETRRGLVNERDRIRRILCGAGVMTQNTRRI